MSDLTKIEWADSTFNPWIGCTRVSPACDHCYAAVSTPARALGVEWGAGKPRKRTSAANWKPPERWNREPFFQCACGWRGADLRDHYASPDNPDTSGCSSPTPARRRVFSSSLADWLDNEVPVEWLVDFLDLIRRTPNLDWLLLTKRIGNWRNRLEKALMHAAITDKPQLEAWIREWLCGSAPAHIWLGSTVVNRPEMLRDGRKLKDVPARVHFWSVEPLLEALGDIPRELMPEWVIVGGESGLKARPMHPAWVRSLRDQCQQAGVPFHFKQWGEWAPGNGGPGGDPYEIDRTKVQSGFFTYADAWHQGVNPFRQMMDRVGKKAAGRLLDDRVHNEFPRSEA